MSYDTIVTVPRARVPGRACPPVRPPGTRVCRWRRNRRPRVRLNGPIQFHGVPGPRGETPSRSRPRLGDGDQAWRRGARPAKTRRVPHPGTKAPSFPRSIKTAKRTARCFEITGVRRRPSTVPVFCGPKRRSYDISAHRTSRC